VSVIDRELLAERAMAVDRHLQRVAARLPQSAADLIPATDPSDAVILHLRQATQIVIDLAIAACLALKLGTPSSYADAFRRLQSGGAIDAALADRLVRAAGFSNLAGGPPNLSRAAARHYRPVGRRGPTRADPKCSQATTVVLRQPRPRWAQLQH
jgi:uncharacterized protein YutE (UPF0331/DUF86 family)